MAYIERRKYKTKTSYLVMVRRKDFKTMIKTLDTRTNEKKLAIERKLDTGAILIIARCLNYYFFSLLYSKKY